MFEFQSKVRYSEVDFREQLNMLGVVNYFQDCSNMQSDFVGGGVSNLHELNYAWVLCTWNIEVKRYPHLEENITIGTFPYEYRGYFGRRNYYIKDDTGVIIASADSMWSLVDYKESKAVRIPEEISNAYTIEEKLPMNYNPKKIIVPKDLTYVGECKAMNHHLDANMHVNNSRFIEMLMDYVEPKDYTNLRVEYRNMARLGDVIKIYKASYNNVDNSDVCGNAKRTDHSDAGDIFVMKCEDRICTIMELT